MNYISWLCSLSFTSTKFATDLETSVDVWCPRPTVVSFSVFFGLYATCRAHRVTIEKVFKTFGTY